MKERPILFSGPLVKALLAGTKTQTRRLMKPQPHPGRWGENHPTMPNGIIGPLEGGLGGGDYHVWKGPRATACLTESGVYVALRQCPYGEQGDRLWVRENLVQGDDDAWYYEADRYPIALEASDPRVPAMIAWAHHKEGERCNSIHMPRWASRITLEVTEVRVERLQSITEEEAKAEGVAPKQASELPSGFSVDDDDWNSRTKEGYIARYGDPTTARGAFQSLWDEINGKRASWASNPWVWVVSFRRLP